MNTHLLLYSPQYLICYMLNIFYFNILVKIIHIAYGLPFCIREYKYSPAVFLLVSCILFFNLSIAGLILPLLSSLDDIINEIFNIIFYQRPLKKQIIGKCSLTGEDTKLKKAHVLAYLTLKHLFYYLVIFYIMFHVRTYHI